MVLAGCDNGQEVVVPLLKERTTPTAQVIAVRARVPNQAMFPTINLPVSDSDTAERTTGDIALHLARRDARSMSNQAKSQTVEVPVSNESAYEYLSLENDVAVKLIRRSDEVKQEILSPAPQEADYTDAVLSRRGNGEEEVVISLPKEEAVHTVIGLRTVLPRQLVVPTVEVLFSDENAKTYAATGNIAAHLTRDKTVSTQAVLLSTDLPVSYSDAEKYPTTKATTVHLTRRNENSIFPTLMDKSIYIFRSGTDSYAEDSPGNTVLPVLEPYYEEAFLEKLDLARCNVATEDVLEIVDIAKEPVAEEEVVGEQGGERGFVSGLDDGDYGEVNWLEVRKEGPSLTMVVLWLVAAGIAVGTLWIVALWVGECRRRK